jgi:hypothetical protein
LYYGVRTNSAVLAKDIIGRSCTEGLIDGKILVEEESPDDGIPTGVRSEQGRLDIIADLY